MSELFEGIPAVEHSVVGKGKVRGVHQVFGQDFPAIGQLSIVILPHKPHSIILSCLQSVDFVPHHSVR